MFKWAMVWCPGSESGLEAWRGIARGVRALSGIVCLALAACGGNDDLPIGAAQAQKTAPSAPVEVARLHAILRPNSAGQWYVQNDGDHASIGISATVEQTPQFVRIFFDRTYTHAGSIQVGDDDDFGGTVYGRSNLGLNNATIRIKARGAPGWPGCVECINPATVYSYVPQGAGNLWINVTMVNKP